MRWIFWSEDLDIANQVVLFGDEKPIVIRALRHNRQEWTMLSNESGQQATDLMVLNAVARDGSPVSEMSLAASGIIGHVPVRIAAWDEMRERNLQNG